MLNLPDLYNTYAKSCSESTLYGIDTTTDQSQKTQGMRSESTLYGIDTCKLYDIPHEWRRSESTLYGIDTKVSASMPWVFNSFGIHPLWD